MCRRCLYCVKGKHSLFTDYIWQPPPPQTTDIPSLLERGVSPMDFIGRQQSSCDNKREEWELGGGHSAAFELQANYNVGALKRSEIDHKTEEEKKNTSLLIVCITVRGLVDSYQVLFHKGGQRVGE